MQSINALPAGSSNHGSLQHLRFIPVDQVRRIFYTNPVDQLSTDYAVLLLAGAGWYDAYGTVDEYFFQCEKKAGEHGEYYELKIGMFVPRLSETDEANMETMKSYRYLVVATDNNGNQRLCGTVENPLAFAARSSTGKSVIDRNGTYIEWSAEYTHRPPYYHVDEASDVTPVQASLDLIFEDVVPQENDTFTIFFPHSPVGYNQVFTWKNVPVTPDEIGTGTHNAEEHGKVFNEKIRTWLLANEPGLILDNCWSSPYPMVQRFRCKAADDFDGALGNSIILSWSRAGQFTVASPIHLSGGAD